MVLTPKELQKMRVDAFKKDNSEELLNAIFEEMIESAKEGNGELYVCEDRLDSYAYFMLRYLGFRVEQARHTYGIFWDDLVVGGKG